MQPYTLNRTGHAPLAFEGHEIAHLYGRWADGRYWQDYHNFTVYRTSSDQYVIVIQYRAHWPLGEPHDIAVLCEDIEEVANVLADYAKTGTVQPRLVQRRYRKQVTELLQAVRTVESGLAPPPLRLAVVIDWGKLDDDVIDDFKERGAAQGISAQEVLRRSVERQMEDEGERGGPVIIHVPDDGDANASEEPEP